MRGVAPTHRHGEGHRMLVGPLAWGSANMWAHALAAHLSMTRCRCRVKKIHIVSSVVPIQHTQKGKG